MPYDKVTIDSIREMVRDFYAHILRDDILGPIFIKSLGDDVNSGKWPEHLHTLDRFWGLMMSGQKGYMGNPFPAHALLSPLYRETFERWLALFHEVVYRLFVPEIAAKFYKKADILAEHFMDNLGINDEEENE